jgi:hypothetical protein
MMEAASVSETLVNFYQTTTQKTTIFILAAVRTSNLTEVSNFDKHIFIIMNISFTEQMSPP